MPHLRHAIAALVVLAATASARAALVTQTYDFSLNGFIDGSYVYPPPADQTVAGSFTITFDPTQSYPTDTTAGLVLNDLSPSQLADGGVGFQYNPAQGGELDVGGLADNVRILTEDTNDFGVGFSNVQTTPRLEGLDYTEVGYPGAAESTGVGSLTVTTVPEPATLGLLGLAAALLGRSRRR